MSLIAKDLISDIITEVELTDNGEKALSMMNIFQVSHLPIVDKGILINILKEDDILLNGFQKKIRNYELSDKKISVNKNCHIFNIIDVLAKNNLSLIPVTNEDGKCLGSITQQDLFQYFGDIFTFEFPGSIIEIEILVKDYSLTEISRIVESEKASIIGLMVNENNTDIHKMDVIIKLNRKNISRIIASLERYGYEIKSTYSSENFSEDVLKERYDALMHYLNV